MLIGLGTGSTGTAELARILRLPHERRFLPWEPERCPGFLWDELPRLRAQGGEVGLYLLPYAEQILQNADDAKVVCMQRDEARVVRGLTRKLGRNPFAIEEDAAAFGHGFPFYGGVTLAEGVSRFYREYYARAYDLQRRYPGRFRVFFTDHLLGSGTPDLSTHNVERLADLAKASHEALWEFCGDEIERASRRAEVA